MSEKKFKLPVLFCIILGGIIIAAIVFIAIFVPGSGKSGGKGNKKDFETYAKEGYELMESTGDGNDYLVNTNGKIISNPAGYDYTISAIGNVCAYEDSEQTLFVVRGDAAKQVDTNIFRYYLSADGSGLTYIRNKDGMTGELCLYDVTTGETKVISDKAFYNRDVVISPDGKTVAFCDLDDSDVVMKVSVNAGSSEVIGREMRPIAVSNHGDYLYYLENKEALLVKHGQASEELSKDYIEKVYINQDGSELMFTLPDGTYISKNGGKMQKFSDQEFYNVIGPKGVTWYKTKIMVSDADNQTCIRFGVKNFQNQVCSMKNGYFYVGSDTKTTEIATYGEVDQIIMSTSGDEIIFEGEGKAYKITDFESGKRKEMTINEEDGIHDVAIDSDGSNTYLLTTKGELYRQSGKKKAEKIAEEIDAVYLDPIDNTVYVFKSLVGEYGDIYYLNQDNEPIMLAENVRSAMYHYRLYSINDRSSLKYTVMISGKPYPIN